MLPENTDPAFKDAFESLMIDNAKLFPPPLEGITARTPLAHLILTYFCMMLIVLHPGDEQISEHVKVRIYQPPGFESDPQKLRPVVVWYHGGGWMSGNLDTEDHFCRTVCGRADAVVVSVLYRHFPEIRFPENIQDCFDGFQWVRSSFAAPTLLTPCS